MPMLTKQQIMKRFFHDDVDEDNQLDACAEDLLKVQLKAIVNGRTGVTFQDEQDFWFAIGMEIEAVAVHGDIPVEDVRKFYDSAYAEGVEVGKRDAAAAASRAAVAALPKGATKAQRIDVAALAASAVLTPPKKKGKAMPAASTTKGKGRKAA